MKDLTDYILLKELEYARSISIDTLQRCINRLIETDENYDAES